MSKSHTLLSKNSLSVVVRWPPRENVYVRNVNTVNWSRTEVARKVCATAFVCSSGVIGATRSVKHVKEAGKLNFSTLSCAILCHVKMESELLERVAVRTSLTSL